MDRLSRRYAIISQYSKDNPTLGLTEQDVRNMTILTHNQGSGKMFNFGQNPNYTIDDQVELLRALYYGDASDLSSTDWGVAEEIFGEELVKYFHAKLENDPAESYISKVNRYIDRRITRYDEIESEELIASSTPTKRSVLKKGGYDKRFKW